MLKAQNNEFHLNTHIFLKQSLIMLGGKNSVSQRTVDFIYLFILKRREKNMVGTVIYQKLGLFFIVFLQA